MYNLYRISICIYMIAEPIKGKIRHDHFMSKPAKAMPIITIWVTFIQM